MFVVPPGSPPARPHLLEDLVCEGLAEMLLRREIDLLPFNRNVDEADTANDDMPGTARLSNEDVEDDELQVVLVVVMSSSSSLPSGVQT